MKARVWRWTRTHHPARTIPTVASQLDKSRCLPISVYASRSWAPSRRCWSAVWSPWRAWCLPPRQRRSQIHPRRTARPPSAARPTLRRASRSHRATPSRRPHPPRPGRNRAARSPRTPPPQHVPKRQRRRPALPPLRPLHLLQLLRRRRPPPRLQLPVLEANERFRCQAAVDLRPKCYPRWHSSCSPLAPCASRSSCLLSCRRADRVPGGSSP